MSTFVEVYANAPLAGSKAASVVDAGLAWLLRAGRQPHVNFGGLLDGRNENFIGTGLDVRF